MMQYVQGKREMFYFTGIDVSKDKIDIGWLRDFVGIPQALIQLIHPTQGPPLQLFHKPVLTVLLRFH